MYCNYHSHLLQASEADPNSLWEDEDTRSFYEGITDIKPFVPAVSSSDDYSLMGRGVTISISEIFPPSSYQI